MPRAAEPMQHIGSGFPLISRKQVSVISPNETGKNFKNFDKKGSYWYQANKQYYVEELNKHQLRRVREQKIRGKKH